MIDRKEIYLAVACFFAGITLVGAFNGCLFTETPGQEAPYPGAASVPYYPESGYYNPGVFVFPSQPGEDPTGGLGTMSYQVYLEQMAGGGLPPYQTRGAISPRVPFLGGVIWTPVKPPSPGIGAPTQ